MRQVAGLRSGFSKQQAPFTMTLIVVLIASALTFWFAPMAAGNLFFGPEWLSKPWTLLTYPFAFSPLADPFGLIFFVFLLLWLFTAGTSIEREIGPWKMFGIWLLGSILPAVLMGVYMMATGTGRPVTGPFLPLEALTIVWCTRNLTGGIMLYGVLPLSGKWFAWLTVAGVIFFYGFGNPVLGLLAALPLAFFYYFALNKIPFFSYTRYAPVSKASLAAAKATEKQRKEYYDDVQKREKERKERDELRKLFERSMIDDPDSK